MDCNKNLLNFWWIVGFVVDGWISGGLFDFLWISGRSLLNFWWIVGFLVDCWFVARVTKMELTKFGTLMRECSVMILRFSPV